MYPFFFGEVGQQLFGAHHAVRDDAAPRATCVVLAYPWLAEYHASHMAFRKLAGLLERAGFSTLRFDYSGMGDSNGTPPDHFCSQWSSDIVRAAKELLLLSGARSVAVVGFGLGATLAIKAAENFAFDALVLWEPVVSGARYLTQLDQLDLRQRMMRLYPAPQSSHTRTDLLGFPFSQAARRELAALDLLALQPIESPMITIVAPSQGLDERALQTKFPGAHLELVERGAKREEMGQEAMLTMEPLHAIVRTLERGEAGVMEKVVSFGGHGDQVGILTLPKDDAYAQRPAILMWNVGVNHRVGQFRIYVDLCRTLADGGYAAFRFDASGLGDSGVRREAVSDMRREELDVADAMSAVTQRTGIRSFILIGFCSSVDAAHRVSVKDGRVVGVVYLEGYSYPTRGAVLRRPLRWVSRRRWERRAWMAFPALFRKHGGPLNLHRESVYKRDYPEWKSFSRDLEGLTERGVQLLFVYAGGDTEFSYRGQFWEMFGTPRIDRRKVKVIYFGDADHTFFDVSIRNAVIRRVLDWVRTMPAVAVPIVAEVRSSVR